ncbi:histidine kinase [Cellulomonas sp. P5_C5]
MPDDPQPADTPDAAEQPAAIAAQPVEPSDVPPASSEPVALDARGVPIPSEAELDRVAEPAVVRHAPKYGAFITTGVLVGIVVGLVLVAVVRPEVPWVADGSGFISFLDGEGAVRTVMAVAGGVLGGFLGGLVAVLADRRSVRKAVRPTV